MEQRFEMKVDRSGNCHRWTGAHRGAYNGGNYGSFWVPEQGRALGAHVVALMLAGVEIPPGMTVDHVRARGCEYHDCVRVDHLEVVTMAENIRRGGNGAKKRCKRGHEFTGPPMNERGHRKCWTCKDLKNAELRAERRRLKESMPAMAQA